MELYKPLIYFLGLNCAWFGNSIPAKILIGRGVSVTNFAGKFNFSKAFISFSNFGTSLSSPVYT